MSRLFGILALFGLISPAASAHEFWIQPHEYRIEAGTPLIADLRVGQDFKGNAMSYFPDTFTVFSITGPNSAAPINGRIGDRPAVNITPLEDGLQILSHVSTTSRLDYSEFAKFERFVTNHSMGWVLEAHAARGLPELGFHEGFTRFVKSLVAVGSGAGHDQYTGMFFEIVALENPYTGDISDGLPVVLLFQSSPIPDIQIDLFFQGGDELTKTRVFTDANGRAIIPNLGAGEYMINAVHMIIPFEADMARTGIVWHSLWASLTYAIGT